MKALALCTIGLEKVVANEIKRMGYKVIDSKSGMIFFETDLEGIYKVNISSRVVERLMIVLKEFRAYDFDDLYNEIFSIDWKKYLYKDTNITIDKMSSKYSRLYGLSAMQSVAQKAIYESLKKSYNLDDWTEKKYNINVRVYTYKDKVTVALDTSGEPLHKRGYRKLISDAPIKETLAAGLIILSGWKRKYPLYDPFCGSGTIPIEALMYAMDYAPGLKRKFGINNLKIHNKELFEKTREFYKNKIRTDIDVNIIGSDIDPEIIRVAKTNLNELNLEKHITFTTKDFTKIENELENGFIITNPPYGERLNTNDEIDILYKKMKKLKVIFPNWKYNFITTYSNFDKYFEMKSNKRKKIQNGKLETYFYMYG
ncbi:methylase [Tepiditoga spiralis]|uniref:Methylase n=1 Tax=Tepiditoga spiralis TaxID=2108365 RepID=A0A7G1G910_9BACT|nr:class I SAM-dependent RNA methyltransferase [Tepiditoga spiralis]BBE31413.1 methylase [Tepiditoga spiralis]